MSNLKWNSEEIEAVITAAFSRLGHHTVKSEQLAAREFAAREFVSRERVCEWPGCVCVSSDAGS